MENQAEVGTPKHSAHAMSAGKHIQDYSMQFQNEFVTLLSRTYGTQRVKANDIYQEYIRDKNHLHVNATRWGTVAGFISNLGQAGIVGVEDTEEELFISWIDKLPANPERFGESDDQSERQMIGERIEHAAAIEQQARGGRDEAGYSSSNSESPPDLWATLPKRSWKKLPISAASHAAATHRTRALLLKPSSEWPPLKPEMQLRIDYHPQTSLPLCPLNRPPDIPRNVGLRGEELVQEVTIGRLERCYANQPKHPAGSAPTLTIILEEELAGGIRESPAQTWIARSSSSGDECIVAKIFEPLYFKDESLTLDAFRIVDQSVAMECESYKRLVSLQGFQIPKFLGLYLASFAIPNHPTRFTPPPPSRNVYVLLMEYVTRTAHCERTGPT